MELSLDSGDDWSTENRSDWSFDCENSASDKVLMYQNAYLFSASAKTKIFEIIIEVITKAALLSK